MPEKMLRIHAAFGQALHFQGSHTGTHSYRGTHHRGLTKSPLSVFLDLLQGPQESAISSRAPFEAPHNVMQALSHPAIGTCRGGPLQYGVLEFRQRFHGQVDLEREGFLINRQFFEVAHGYLT